MKAFVTGVNGQLGHDVILELKKRNIEALASDLSNTPHNLDITDSNQVNNLLLSLKPDVIIHCAAYTQVDKAEEDKDNCYKVNVIGTNNLVEVAKKLDSNFIYISTDYVFGDDSNIPHKPDDTDFNPLNIYGSTKLEGEQIVSKALSKYYIVRTSWVYGLNGNNFVKTMLKLAETHKELRVVNDQIGNPTNTKDLSKLLVDMALADKYGYYNATNDGDYISWSDFASKIFELAHKDTKVIPVSTKKYGQSKAIRPLNSRLDKTKLEDNGFDLLVNWEESLKEYLKLL